MRPQTYAARAVGLDLGGRLVDGGRGCRVAQDRPFAQATAATGVSYPPERRLSGAQLASYLDRRAFAVVGLHPRERSAARDNVRLRPARRDVLAADEPGTVPGQPASARFGQVRRIGGVAGAAP